MEERSEDSKPAKLEGDPQWPWLGPGPAYQVGWGGYWPVESTYFSAHLSAQSKATAKGMYAV